MELKDYETMSLSSWAKVGEGGNGITYENPADADVLRGVFQDEAGPGHFSPEP